MIKIENFNDLEFRCHALGKIAYSIEYKKDGTQSKVGGKLTKGNMTYLRGLFTELTTGRRKEVTSKYFEKGNFMEEDGVTMVNATLYPDEFLVKNKVRKRNGWIEGECDLLAPDEIVYDIKNAWDVFTFGEASLTDEYEWQGRGYMWLENVDRFRLFYCLNNMPEHMLINLERKMFYAEGRFVSMEDPEYLQLCEELRANHNYDHLPIEERFKVFEIERSAAKEDELRQFISKSREYLNDQLETRKLEISSNRTLMGLPPRSSFIAKADKEVGTTIVTQMFENFKPAT